ncbi:DUF1330 domain-containing protein [Streptomyces sp. NPDC091217]|uniref:DUF1330 domain-containing protein n=1 Tax=Streptomyces sp. NPDC091217 TaxID=3365975 RepID=UPI0038025885
MAVYMIALNRILDKEAWDEYHASMPALIKKYGIKPHSGGAFVKRLEGEYECDYLGMLEFPDQETVGAFLASPEYKELVPLMQRAAQRTLFSFEELPIGQS